MKNRAAPAVLLFIPLVFLLYYPVLDDYFISDDFYFIDHTDPGFATASWTTFGFFRPLIRMSFVVDANLWKAAPSGYHLTNIALHCCAVFLVFFLCRTLCGPKTAFGASFLSALFFAVHPIHVEPVAWISGRSELLAACFFLLSLVLFLESGKPSRGWLYPAAAIACFSIGLTAKETVLMALPAAVVLFFLFPSSGGERKKATLLLYAFTAVSVCFLLFRIFLFPGGPSLTNTAASQLFQKLSVFVRMLIAGEYYPWLLLPVILFLLLWICFKKPRLFIACLALIVFPLVPVLFFGFVRERYLYLPSAGLCLLLGIAITTLRTKNRKMLRFAPYLIAIFLCVFFTVSVRQKLPRWDEAGDTCRLLSTRLAAVSGALSGSTVYYCGIPGFIGKTGLLFIGLEKAASFLAEDPTILFKPLGPGEIEKICLGKHRGDRIGGVFEWTGDDFQEREDLLRDILAMQQHDSPNDALPCWRFPGEADGEGWFFPQTSLVDDNTWVLESTDQPLKLFYKGKPLNSFRAALVRITGRAVAIECHEQGEIIWEGAGGRGAIFFRFPADGLEHTRTIRLFQNPAWATSGPIIRLAITPFGCPGRMEIKEVCFSPLDDTLTGKKGLRKDKKRRKGW